MFRLSLIRMMLALSLALGVAGCPTDDDDDSALPDDYDDDATDDDDSGDDDDSAPVDTDGDGVPDEDDCEPEDGSIYPGAAEGCDGVDTDCDGELGGDEQDADEDGATPCDGDCDDDDANRSPDFEEICNDGLDDDCDETTDENVDGDGDGVTICAADCDDADDTVYPDAPELCDGADQDCNDAADFALAVTVDEAAASEFTGADRARGNAYRIDADINLVAFEQVLGVPEGESITWAVYSSDFPTTDFALETASASVVDAADADVLQNHSSPELNVVLEAGRYYALIAWWSADVTYAFEPTPSSINVLDAGVGARLTALSAGSDALPAGEDLFEPESTAWYPQTVVFSGEADFDADGSLWCDDDCNDGSADASPGGTEVECDGLDNDCDGETLDCDGVLIVNEVFNDAAGSDTDQEWFELYNSGATDIDLSNWLFRDFETDDLWFDNGGAIVPAGSYAVFAQTDDVSLNGGVTVEYAYGSQIGLSNSADELVLVNPIGEVVDAVAWNTDAGWPGQGGNSLNLDPTAQDALSNDTAANWCVSYADPWGTGPSVGTPGAANVSCTIAPSGAVFGDLVINEIFRNPDGDDGDREWFEVYNASSGDIDLLGFTVSDLGTDSFTITTSVVVPSGAYAVLVEEADTSLNGNVTADVSYLGNLTLGNADDELILTSPEGVEIDAVEWAASGWPDAEGASMSLDPCDQDAIENNDADEWYEDITNDFGSPLGDDTGTPGASNGPCIE